MSCHATTTASRCPGMSAIVILACSTSLVSTTENPAAACAVLTAAVRRPASKRVRSSRPAGASAVPSTDAQVPDTCARALHGGPDKVSARAASDGLGRLIVQIAARDARAAARTLLDRSTMQRREALATRRRDGIVDAD